MEIARDTANETLDQTNQSLPIGSWDDFVRTHWTSIYRTAYRLTGNPHDAEDLTQDVFVRVFRRGATYVPGNLEGWLYRVTVNLFLDGTRRTRRLRIDPMDTGSADRLASQAPTPAQVIDDHTFDHDIRAALDDLPASFRAVFVLGDLDGVPHERIAEIMNIKVGTVRTRLHRARHRLRKALASRSPSRAETSAPVEEQRYVA